jgi:hypothetical protein
MIAKLHRFVRLAVAEDYLRLGWMATQALRGTYHGQYSVHMVWLCDCEARWPRRVAGSSQQMHIDSTI